MLASAPARSKVTAIASNRSAAANRRFARSPSQLAAILRTCSRLRQCTDSNGVRPGLTIRLLTSTNAIVLPSNATMSSSPKRVL
jgi:hypothetical protein